jgi:hypothetical protein
MRNCCANRCFVSRAGCGSEFVSCISGCKEFHVCMIKPFFMPASSFLSSDGACQDMRSGLRVLLHVSTICIAGAPR